MSILFDEELFLKAANQKKLKTCFVESFKFTTFKNRTNDLEIPLREYLQFIPQDFYYYQGSLTQPPCSESVSWIVFKQPQVITSTQLNQLKSLIKLPKGNIRGIQQMSSDRKIFFGGSQQVKNLVTLQTISLSIIMKASVFMVALYTAFMY